MKHEILLWTLVAIAIVYIVYHYKDFAACCNTMGAQYQNYSTYRPSSSGTSGPNR